MRNSQMNFQNETREKSIPAFIRQQKSAATITLFGPTGSAKSTLITELLPSGSNKLLGYNIGDVAQTTLVRLCLMLNSRLMEDEVIVRCIPYADLERVYWIFLTELKMVLADGLYEKRDELEEYVFDLDAIKSILNPINRSFHVYEYAKEKDFVNSLAELIEEIMNGIIKDPVMFDEEADKLFKQRRKEIKTIKKKEIFEEVFDRRFSENEAYGEKLKKWFGRFNEKIYADLEPLWSMVERDDAGNPAGYILYGQISDQGGISQLMKMLYEKNSACSMIFEEVDYITSPSHGFMEYYKRTFQEKGIEMLGRNLKVNIIDTVGLTQISEEKDGISDAMDYIFQRETDAFLFLCATDEKPSVYDTCMELLHEKSQRLNNKAVTICRTKADLILRNILVNTWRKDTGKNEIDEGRYAEYLTRAYDTFLEEYISMEEGRRSAEYRICAGRPLEFLSMAPDYTKEMNRVLQGELESAKVFKIISSIVESVDKRYSLKGERLWLYSDDFVHYPISLVCRAHELNKTVSFALVTCNSKQCKQYMQYVGSQKMFHWNSVYCFYKKLGWGEGHETKAFSYENFKLFLRNMVAKWLREIVPMEDIIHNFELSYEHLQAADDSIIEQVKKTFPDELKTHIRLEWSTIIGNVAKKLTYDCLQPGLDQIYNRYSFDTAFRESLKYFYIKYSDEKYWESMLLGLMGDEVDSILRKMYVFDEA